jgi:lysophospholipase L1-like esterase
MDTNGASGTCILSSTCFTSEPLDRLYNLTKQSMAGLNPDIVIMNGGANDFCCGNPQDPVRVENYMRQWIQLMWTIKPSAYLIVLGLTGDYHVEYDNWIKQYASQQAAAGKHIAYVYIADVTTNDTVHPNNPGYETISNRIMRLITPMMHQLTAH